MTEELSEFIMLSVTVCALSIVVSTAASLTLMSNNLILSYITKASSASDAFIESHSVDVTYGKWDTIRPVELYCIMDVIPTDGMITLANGTKVNYSYLLTLKKSVQYYISPVPNARGVYTVQIK